MAIFLMATYTRNPKLLKRWNTPYCGMDGIGQFNIQPTRLRAVGLLAKRRFIHGRVIYSPFQIFWTAIKDR